MKNNKEARKRCVPEVPSPGKKIRILIDTDAATEMDDQYAIALALLSPERLNIQGFVGAHFGDKGGIDGPMRSVREIEAMLELAGMQGRYPVMPGGHPMQYNSIPSESEGVDFIIERAMASTKNDPLYIVGLASCTNIASAWLKCPEIADRVVVLWHGRTKFWPDKFNNMNLFRDPKSANIVFESDLPLILFDTGTYLYVTMDETRKELSRYGALGKYLHEIRYRYTWTQLPNKAVFDLGDIAYLLDPSLAYSEVTDVPLIDMDFTFKWDQAFGKLRRVFQIDRDRTLGMLYKKIQKMRGK